MSEIIEKQITTKDLNEMFLRMQLFGVTNNFETMQAMGFCSSFIPIMNRLYKDYPLEKRIEVMKRHLQFYNSHNNSNALILGIAAAVEESSSWEEKDAVTAIKTGLMGPLAGIGDSLLKFTWLPIAGSIGASLALSGSVLGPIVMFLLYNIANVGTKYYGVHLGYKKGMEFLSKGSNIVQRVYAMSNVVGLMVVGGLIASSVKIKLAYEITAGENVIPIQDMLDKVMPGLLSLIVTFTLYRIFKKNQGKHAVLMIIVIMVVSVLLVTLGVLK